MKPISPYFAPAFGMLLLVGGLAGCGSGESPAPQAQPTNALTVMMQADAEIKSITLPYDEPDMPDAPGRTEFNQACIICHSPRYIAMQPPFPRKTWQDIVAKMVKVYGAHVDEEQMHKIVDYLVVIKGSQTGDPAK